MNFDFNPRLMNIFDQFGAAAPNYELKPFEFSLPSAPQPYRTGGMMDWNELASMPSAPALEAYKQHVSQMPQRSQFAPGKLDRLAAALAGVSSGWQQGAGAGIKSARDILDSKYQRAQADWMSRGAGLKEAAGLEQTEMQRRNDWMKTNRQALMDDFKFKLDMAKTQADIEKIHNDIRISGFKTGVDENGNQILYDLKNPEAGVRTLFKTNEMTPADRVSDRQNRLDVANIRERGANNRLGIKFGQDQALLKQRGEIEAGLVDRRGAEQRKTDAAKPRTALSEPSASEQMTADKEALKEMARKIDTISLAPEETESKKAKSYKLTDFLRQDGTLKSRMEVVNDADGWITDDSVKDRLAAYDFLVNELTTRRTAIAGRK